MARFPVLQRTQSIPSIGPGVPVDAKTAKSLLAGSDAAIDLADTVGQAAADVGQVFKRARDKELKRQQDITDANFLTERTTAGQTQLIEHFAQARREDDPTDPQFHKRLDERTEQIVAAVLQDLPALPNGQPAVSKEVVAQLRARLERTRLGILEQGLRVGQAATDARALDNIDGRINDLAAKVRRNPSLFGSAFGGLDGLFADYETSLPADVVRDKKAEARETLLSQQVLGLLDAGDIDAARAMLEEESFDKLLSPRQREALLGSIEGAVRDQEVERKRREAEAERQVKEVRARRAAELEVAVSRGQAGHSELAYALKHEDITPSAWADLTKQVDKHQAEALETEAQLGLVASALDGTIALDPHDGDHKKAVERYFNRVLLPEAAQAEDPEDGQAVIAQFVTGAGIVPPSLKGQIVGTLRTGDAERKFATAQLLDRIATQQPAALGDFDREDIALAEGIIAWSERGAAPKVAVERAQEAIAEADDTARLRRRERLRQDKLTEAALAQFEGEFGDVEIPDELAGAFIASFEGLFAGRAGGDADVAARVAMKELRTVWAVTEADGHERWMRMAPEAVYANGAGTDWIGEQLLGDLQNSSLFASDIKGRVRLEYAGEVDEDQKPVYLVLLQDESGAWQPMIGPEGAVRWRPVWTESEAYKRMVEAGERERAEALGRAKALRETAGTPEVLN